MSRSSTDPLAIGVGTCDVAIGTRRRSWPKWAANEWVARVIHRAARGSAAPGAPKQDARAQDASVHDASTQVHTAQNSPVREALTQEPHVETALAETAFEEHSPAAVAALPHHMVEIDTARHYTDGGALDALGRALADVKAASPPKRRAAVVLDDFWGHHTILQGDFRALRAKEIDEVAAAYFADTFGVDGETLSIRWQVQPGGRALFASALPRALTEGIRAEGDAARVEITSITLALPQMLNRVRSAISGRNGWLLVATGTLLHAVTIANRGWTAYDTERLFHASANDAASVADAARQMFERRAASRHAESDVYLCGLSLDAAPFERSFARIRTLPEHMSNAAPALTLMELAS